jgi:polysaccharide export outer membrane protein
MGSVVKTMSIDLSPMMPMTALHAIAQAGGFSPEANTKGVVVVRRQLSDGKTVVLPVPDPDKPEDILKDVQLMAKDVVLVPRLDRVYVLGEVEHPGGVPLDASAPMTAVRALSMVGGFARFARRNAVQVLRANGTGNVTLDLEAVLNGSKQASDLTLLPGDILFVPQARF